MLLLLACCARGASGRRIGPTGLALVRVGTVTLKLFHGHVRGRMGRSGLRRTSLFVMVLMVIAARWLGLTVKVARTLLQNTLLWLLD